jgi:hypothetical protein
MLPNMFLAYIRLIFRGSSVEITTAILLVYNFNERVSEDEPYIG